MSEEERKLAKPGQKHPTPTPGNGDRVFYETLLKQRPDSHMALLSGWHLFSLSSTAAHYNSSFHEWLKQTSIILTIRNLKEWCVQYGVLDSDAAHKAYKKVLKRKEIAKTSGSGSKSPPRHPRRRKNQRRANQ
ncbi:hypothetical protein THAOC_14261 [Thalassiosira oceanica]|uniref:Uncharacterized protein n=1 Tax=Thalassiosira oceanica TaxID=159749 RepID=K0SHU5_THAOC|nr:hypothetical protein THAOC_14261 [Thalassiosira oceanica]|eukprot:EJK64950.1 hypothetical protein THAOC_14261 [Thalassiosira oceanica]